MIEDRQIYMDYNATTPVDPRVIDAMLPCLHDRFGNASSSHHAVGRAAREAIERARGQAANLIGAEARDLIWTSGATEGNNMALSGLARFWLDQPVGRGRHLVASSIEHPSVHEVFEFLAGQGFEVSYVDPEPSGIVTAAAIEQALREQTLLVSVMWANNETGVLNDIATIGTVCKRRHVFFHSDATQAVGKVPVDVVAGGVDLLTWSAHKHYGPQGVGAVYLRRRDPRVRIKPLLLGGGQERGHRSGTHNLAGIVGMGRACELCMQLRCEEAPRLAALRDRLEESILAALPDARVNGDRTRRLPQTTNLSFGGLDAQRIMAAMPGLAVSSGAACSSEGLKASRVLRRMGLSAETARSSIRFSIGRETTDEEIDAAAAMVIEAAAAVRRSPSRALSTC